MKKILFYCQYHLGMGHLVRSTEILRSLAQEFKVCFVKAGSDIQGFEFPAGIEIVTLPLLLSENKQVKVADSSQNLEEVKESRKNLLLKVFDEFKPDALMIEGYPFKKYQFEFESIPLLERIQALGRSTKVVCSLRDVVMAQFYQDREAVLEKTCQLLNKYFDLLLVHSDPIFHSLEESFPRIQDIHCDIQYTGFVAQSSSKTPAKNDEDLADLNRSKKMILVSVGGGQLGQDLLESMIETSPIFEKLLPDRHLQVFTGPWIPSEKFFQLQKAAENKANLTLRKYTSQLLAYMEKAELSISLCGYNTAMNIIRTGVKSMMLPSNKDWEQKIRAEKLEKLGLVKVIQPDDLQPERLAQKIIEYLHQETVMQRFKAFKLQGAQKTADLLKELLKCKVIA
jgi:predicted glycosyltransferase